MELILLKLDSKELEYIWNYIEKHPINEGVEDPTRTLNNGYGWAYMGSFMQGNRVIHQIQHKNHPSTNTIKTICLNASDGFNPNEDIEKSFRLK